jgi:hypothetical protein
LNGFILDIFNYYRNNGFPYYSTYFDDRVKDFDKLIAYDNSKLLNKIYIPKSILVLKDAYQEYIKKY